MKNERGFTPIVLSAVFALLIAGCAGVTTQLPAVPLPTEIKINPPTPETPKELASCLGAWGGWWTWTATGNTTETALIVENVDAKSAQVVYARGRGADGSPGWWTRSFATLEEGSIVLRFGSIVRTFTCKGNSVAGTYEVGDRTTGYATLTKFTLAVAPSVKAEPAAVETTTDPAPAEKLIAGSPFSGTAMFPTGTFDVEFTFLKDEKGNLHGALTRTTSRIASPGPLRWVVTKNGSVTFTTEIGVNYELAFDSDGNLVGKVRSPFGDGEVKLRPK